MELQVQCEALSPAWALLRGQENNVCALGGISHIQHLDPADDAPQQAATAAVEGLKLHLLGAVDPRAEKKRLEKQQATLTGGLAGLEAKLSNEKFLSNAPREVVQREQARGEKLREELKDVQAALAELQ